MYIYTYYKACICLYQYYLIIPVIRQGFVIILVYLVYTSFPVLLKMSSIGITDQII